MKGSLDSFRFAEITEEAFRKVSPVFNLHKLPIADGGDGSGAVLMKALNANPVLLQTRDPLDREIVAQIAIADDTAIIEMASASGMKLLNTNELNPLRTTSYGTGILLKQAIEMGCKKILLCIGGSATIDGGLGLLSAMGFVFRDNKENILPPMPESMTQIHDFQHTARTLPKVEIVILSDVNNPLLGENGAAKTFGAQKGADENSIPILENGLTHWVDILEKKTGKNLREMEGMGAAGGVALGLVALFDAQIVQGSSLIFETLHLKKYMDWADWIITGEGRLDMQTLSMKAPFALAEKARAVNKPVTVLCGSFEPGVSTLFDGVFSIIGQPTTLEQAMAGADKLLETAAGQLARLFLRNNNKLFENHKLIESAHKHLSNSKKDSAWMIIEQIDNNLAAYWYLKGLYFKAQQIWGEAINCFSKALEMDEGLTKAAVNIEMIKNIMRFTNPQMLNP